MCVHATQTTKAIDRDTYALEIRKLNAAIVANHYVLDVAAAVD